jgi:hypothetical protein
MSGFVQLHRAAAVFTATRWPEARIATAWPLSDALRRPEFGYVAESMRVLESEDFRPSSTAVWKPEEVDALILYSREWEPPFNLMEIGWVRELWRRYFHYEPQVTSEECRRRYGLQFQMRWESHGQWIEVLAR